MPNISHVQRETLPNVGLHVKAPTESASHFVQQSCLIELTLLATLATKFVTSFKALPAQALGTMNHQAVLSHTCSFSF